MRNVPLLAASAVLSLGGVDLLRPLHNYDEPEPTEPGWNRGNNWKYRDTKPHHDLDKRDDKRRAQRKARRQTRRHKK